MCFSERKEKAIPHRGAENRKGKGTDRGKPGLRSLEAESIRSRAESMEGSGVVLKTVREHDNNNVHLSRAHQRP